MSKKFTLASLAQLTHSELVGDPEKVITGVETLETATPSDASFLSNPKYHEAMVQSQAGVVCIDKNTTPVPGRNFLISENPSSCFQTIIELLVPDSHSLPSFSGIHPTAVVHATVKIGKNVSVGPYTVIDADAIIGDDTSISPLCHIGARVEIGTLCQIHSHVSIRENCKLGHRVILQPGVVIGSCGFGYVTDAKGNHTKLQQLGNVILEDDVEIGANTTIDRARFKSTKICRGSKIDNLVQIGHNVEVGPYNIIVSQTGIAGSTKTGRYVVLGGQVGVVGHVEIADGTIIAAKGGVSKTISKGGKYAGVPVMSLSNYNRQQVLLRNIEEHVSEINTLKERLENLEKNQDA